MDVEVDLIADLSSQDDDGMGWSLLSNARHPGRLRTGAMVLAGNDHAQAVVRIEAIDDDGQVHFSILPGSIAQSAS